MELQMGDLLLFKGKSLMSRAIQVLTQSPYSHVAVYIGQEEAFVESNWGGVGIRHIDDIEVPVDVYRHKHALEPDKFLAVEWMKSQIGAKYDYLGIAGIAFGILGLFGYDHKRNPMDDSSRYWCNELVADGYLNAGINIGVDKETWKISPEDLSRNNQFERVGKIYPVQEIELD